MGLSDGTVAVVTGGAGGIGLAAARRLSDDGAHLFITAPTSAAVESAVSTLGPHACGVVADVSQSWDLDRVYDVVSGYGGGIDVLVLAAGYPDLLDAAQWKRIGEFDALFTVALRAVYLGLQRAQALLNAGASVVVVSSALGVTLDGTSRPLYAAAKVAIRSLISEWAATLHARDIRVNLFSIDAVAAADTAEDDPLGGERLVPLSRMTGPLAAADAVYYLACPHSAHLTGHELVADGRLVEI